MERDGDWDNVNVLSHTDAETEGKEDLDEDLDKTFRIRNYIPQRSIKQYLKPCYIIYGVIIIIFMIILITVISIKLSGSSDNSSSYDFPHGIILLDKNRLWVFNPKIKKFTLLHESNDNIDVFEVHSKEAIFISKIFSSKIISLTSKGSSKVFNDTKLIFEEARVTPQAMAIDYITKNLYVLDKIMGSLIVINLQNKNYSLVLNNLIKPHDIVLDSTDGLMFILQQSDSILKGNMDGESMEKIVENSDITAITLDRKNKRIYWVRDFLNIESSDYNGKKAKIFITDSTNVISLSVLDNHLYWLQLGYGVVNGTLSSCRIKNGTCESHRMYMLDSLRNPNLIKSCSDHDSNVLTIANPCDDEKNKCQHICLLTPGGRRSCICNLGWQLTFDSKSCRPVSDFLIYPLGKFIRTRILDVTKTFSVDVTWPVPYYTGTMKGKTSIDYDYDLHNDNFYFSDDTHIFKMKLRTNENQTVILNSTWDTYVEDLAYDWLTGNMYYSLRSRMSYKRHSLVVFNVNRGPKYQKTLSTFVYDSMFGLQACPYALMVYPSRGYLFFTAGQNDVRTLQRTTMKGTKLSEFSIPYVHEFRLIAIDYDKDRIYWIGSSESTTVVKHANFDGTDLKVVELFTLVAAKTIYVHQSYMYLSNMTSIWRFNKETGKGAIEIVSQDKLNESLFGVRVISSAIQSTSSNNICAIDNGGCEQFCFLESKRPCDCRDGDNIIGRGTCV